MRIVWREGIEITRHSDKGTGRYTASHLFQKPLPGLLSCRRYHQPVDGWPGPGRASPLTPSGLSYTAVLQGGGRSACRLGRLPRGGCGKEGE